MILGERRGEKEELEAMEAVSKTLRAAAAARSRVKGQRTHDHQTCHHDVAKLLGQRRGVRALALPDDPNLVARALLRGISRTD